MTLYRVNYTYAAPNTGILRTASIIVAGDDDESARKNALHRLVGKANHIRISRTEPYSPDQAELPLIETKDKKK